MKNRNRNSSQDTADDDGFAEGAGPAFAKGQQEALEERAWLKQCFSKCLEEMEVQPLVGIDVVTDSRKQNL